MRSTLLVFDSGVGGLSVLDAIVAAGGAYDLHYLADSAWLPYGERAPDALRARVPVLVDALAARVGASAVVLACNTASTLALDAVRARLPDVPIVGVVPPVKPAAAATRTGVIGVLATAATVNSPYLDALVREHAEGVTVLRHPAPLLVALAERKLAGGACAPGEVRAAIAGLFAQERGADIDVVALACTHFPLLAQELAAAAPQPVSWLDSGAAIARRARQVAPPPEGAPRLVTAWTTGPSEALQLAAHARGFSSVVRLSPEPPFAGVARDV